jgi:hypothetical protein
VLALGVESFTAQGSGGVAVLAYAYLARNVEIQPRPDGNPEAGV